MRESWTPSSLKWLAQRIGERLVSLADIRPSRLFKVMVKYYILGAMESDWCRQSQKQATNIKWGGKGKFLQDFQMLYLQRPSHFLKENLGTQLNQVSFWVDGESDSLREHPKLVTRAEQEPELLIVQSWIEIPGSRVTDSNPSSVT